MQCLSEREHDLGGQETLCQVWEGFRRSKDVVHRFGCLAHLHCAGAACVELIFVLCTFDFGLQVQRIAGWMARWTPIGKHPDAREHIQGSLAGITARCGCRHLAAQKESVELAKGIMK